MFFINNKGVAKLPLPEPRLCSEKKNSCFVVEWVEGLCIYVNNGFREGASNEKKCLFLSKLSVIWIPKKINFCRYSFL